MDVNVVVETRSVFAPLSLDVPLYLYLVFNLIVGAIVFVKRPDLSSARMLFRFSASFLVAEAIYFLSFSGTDLGRGWLVPLAVAANAVLFFYTFSAALHFALSFPRVQPVLARRPGRVLLAVYAGPWLLYAILMAVDAGAVSGSVRLFLRHWQVTSYVGAMMLVAVLMAFIAAFRRIETSADRRQLRWIVWGTGIAVVPWAAALAISLVTPLHIREAMPVLALSFAAIPATVAIAIVRERMFDIDLIVNRTLVYVLLSAVLAGVYAASVSLVQRAFVAITGAESDSALVLATLIIVIVFAPIRDALQRLVDRRFKGLPAHVLHLRAFGDDVARRLTLVHPTAVCRRLAETAVSALGASGAAIHLVDAPGGSSVVRVGDVDELGAFQVDLAATSGEQIGVLDLGPKLDGRPYDRAERELMAEIAGIVADAIVADRPASAPARRVRARETS